MFKDIARMETGVGLQEKVCSNISGGGFFG